VTSAVIAVDVDAPGPGLLTVTLMLPVCELGIVNVALKWLDETIVAGSDCVPKLIVEPCTYLPPTT
jgi:hypothetical protein